MSGIIYQLNIGSGGVPKLPVPQARVTRERIEGDDWNWAVNKIQLNNKPGGHGGSLQAICLYSLECLARLRGQGFPVFPGALGENFTTQGIDYSQVRTGDTYQVGSVVQIRITRLRQPCGTIRTVYSPGAKRGEGIESAMWDAQIKQGDVMSPKWGMTGFYAEVLVEGTVKKWDRIEKIIPC